MLIRNVTDDDVFAAAIRAGVRVDDFRSEGRGFRFKLRPQVGAETKRRAVLNPRRKVSAVCWHQFGRFMRAIFDRQPDAVIRTGVTTYHGVGEFNAHAYLTGDDNVGNVYYPVARRDTCTCEEEEGYDKANDWV